MVESNINFEFEPLMVYRWIVVGHFNGMDFGTDRIAELHNDFMWKPYNIYSAVNRGIFRTGPMCGSGEVEIPTLLSPVNGDVTSSLKPELIWDTLNCLPTDYWIQISVLEDIQKQPPFFSSTDPADFTLLGISQYAAFDIASNKFYPSLTDCTKYYWRVRGSIGNPAYGETREFGLWSEPGWFFVNSGTCPTPTPTRVPPTRTPTLIPTITPNPITVNCSIYTSQETCASHSTCVWEDSGGDSGPKCVKK
jgi:hypothetical protein